MRIPTLPVLWSLLLAGTAALAQDPAQTREPPYADGVVPAGGRYDPDEDVVPAQYVVPGGIAGPVRGTPVAVSPVYTGPFAELPTPSVTLDIEGTSVSPSGQTVVYKLVVRNVSRARAHNVVVKVVPPKGVEKVKAEPPPTDDAAADTRWELKTLEPGQARTIELAYRPNRDVDEVKIQARVQFDFGRGMITKVAAPTLEVKKEAPETVVVGDTITYRITVTNTGRVTVRNIEVREFLPKGLVYQDRELSRGTVDGRLVSSIDPKTGERTWSIPSLAPGQSERLEYRVKAREAGRFPSTVLVKAPDVEKKAEAETEVLTAQLQMHADGPAAGKGTVGQPAAYRVTVENRGSATLRNVVVRCQVPPDMRTRRATHGGQPLRSGVQWILKELKRGEVKELNVYLATGSPGTRRVQFVARADHGSEQRGEVKTEFAGVPSLDWDVEAPGVGTVGRTTTYRVTVANRGTASGRARLQVDLPPSLDLKNTMPPAGTGIGQNAKEVRFQTYDFPAGKKTTFTITVEPRSAGEAKTIFTLFEEGRAEKREDKVLNVTGNDGRSPAGPPPARSIDPTKVGLAPRE